VVGAAIALVVLLVSGGDRGTIGADEREAVARPAAAATPPYVRVDPNKIVYIHAAITDVEDTKGSTHENTLVLQEWHRGRETHRLETDGACTSLDHVIDADGTMHQIDELGRYRVIRGSNADDASKDAANVSADEQTGFLESLQKLYTAGILDPSEDVTFAGRPAYRFHIAATPAKGPRNRTPGHGFSVTPPGPDQSYFIDRATGEPLGYTSTMQFGPAEKRTASETADRIELLDPTPENLAKLRTLTLKRRG
jgi:hypothetical protein